MKDFKIELTESIFTPYLDCCLGTVKSGGVIYVHHKRQKDICSKHQWLNEAQWEEDSRIIYISQSARIRDMVTLCQSNSVYVNLTPGYLLGIQA